MDRFLALRQIPLFASLDDVALKNLSIISSYKVYKKNEVIFHLGDEGSTLFILNSGSVKIFLNDDKGKEVILKILYKGDFFGEMSLLDGQFRSANVMSVEPSKALIIQREDFLRLIESNPEIALNTMISLSRRLRKIDEKVASLAFLDSYGKVARFLLDFMEDNGNDIDGKVIIETNLTRLQMANMAGISRETLTRIFGEFQKRGVIKVQGRNVTILDESLLKREIM